MDRSAGGEDARAALPSTLAPCSACGAPSGMRCRDASGNVIAAHEERGHASPREVPAALVVACPTCGAGSGQPCRQPGLAGGQSWAGPERGPHADRITVGGLGAKPSAEPL